MKLGEAVKIYALTLKGLNKKYVTYLFNPFRVFKIA